MKNFKKEYILKLTKVIIWRIFAFITTSLIVFFTTGSFELALSIGLLEVSIKTISHFFYEVAWEKIVK